MDPNEKLEELQTVEQNLQAYTVQRQNVHAQILEAESALDALKGSSDAYRIVGNIMVKTPAQDLNQELDQKIETLKKRLDMIEKQEKRLREQAESLQEEIMNSMKEE